MNDDRLAILQASRRTQQMPCRQALDEQAERGSIAYRVRDLEAHRGGHQRLLGVPATARSGEAADAAAVKECAHDLRTRDEGKFLGGEVGVLDGVGIGVVDPRTGNGQDLQTR